MTIQTLRNMLCMYNVELIRVSRVKLIWSQQQRHDTLFTETALDSKEKNIHFDSGSVFNI